MAVSLFTFVRVYDRALAALAHVLDKGAAFAKGKGVGEAEMLEWRLIEDMKPLRFQAQMVVSHSQSWPSRVAGREPPAGLADDADFAAVKAAIAAARDYLKTFSEQDFAGRDEAGVTAKLGPTEMTMTGAEWLSGFAQANVNFHANMAYAILRAHGVELGKRDLFPEGF